MSYCQHPTVEVVEVVPFQVSYQGASHDLRKIVR